MRPSWASMRPGEKKMPQRPTEKKMPQKQPNAEAEKSSSSCSKGQAAAAAAAAAAAPPQHPPPQWMLTAAKAVTAPPLKGSVARVVLQGNGTHDKGQGKMADEDMSGRWSRRLKMAVYRWQMAKGISKGEDKGREKGLGLRV